MAGAQAQRAASTSATLGIFKTLKVKTFTQDSMIESTALVQVSLNQKKSWVFLVPARGSLTVSFEGRTIQVITPQSPLGEGLLGLGVGDIAKVDRNDGRQLEYQVLAIE